ncbi:Flagellar hook-associated protein FliD [hydrothermal vent metagenome]|uniref:Filament cap protein n=1 Tax=hydrothermal vent metagenome TaxID=652676 RepID=A0A3B0XLA1_9ZZZZ
MATITAGGIGSGLDVTGILEQIVAAERGPAESRLNLKEAKLQAELSAFGSLKSTVNTFQASLGKLKSATFFNSSSVDVSNKDVLSASTSSIAQAGNYTVEVKKLAQSQALASVAFNNLTDVIGSGTLTFDFGTTVYDPGTDFATGDDTYTSFTQNTERPAKSVVIDNTNNTISGVRDAINQAGIGVTASIVDNGSGFQLLIASDLQGLDNSLEITVDEGGPAADNIDTTGLSQLAFNINATNIEQTQAADDALLTVNGLSVSRESNTVSGVITGVTLNLSSADPGNPIQVTVSNNNITEAQTNIGNFVSTFNELASTFSSLTEFDGDDGKNGILLGDTTARNIMQQIRREFGGIINNGGSFNGLSSIGISTNRDGTLTLDASELSDALNEDFDSVAQLFYANGNPTDNTVNFISNTSVAVDDDYRVSISSLATQGQLTGIAVGDAFTIDATNNTFSLIVDGISTNTITLSQNTYNRASLAVEIEKQINADGALLAAGVNASVSISASNEFQISSSTYGENSNVSISTQNATLGFDAAAVSSTGTNVVGSIGGSPGTGLGQQLSGSGLVLDITGNATGNLGSVRFSQGLANKLDSLLGRFLAGNGQLSSKTDSINDQIADITVQRTDLDERVTQIETRFRKQFTTLDILLGTLKNTSNFLDTQLAALPTIGGNN